MKVTFTRSGGFANIPLTVTLDTASLPAADAAALEARVEAADFFNLPPAPSGGAAVRDGYQYTVTVTTPERERTVVMSDPMPPAAQKLVDHLKLAGRGAAGRRTT